MGNLKGVATKNGKLEKKSPVFKCPSCGETALIFWDKCKHCGFAFEEEA